MPPAQQLPWRADAKTLTVRVRLTPKSSRNAFDGVETQSDGKMVLRARVRAVPENGLANDALVALLARTLEVPPTSVKLVLGATARTKTLKVEGDGPALAAKLMGQAAA